MLRVQDLFLQRTFEWYLSFRPRQVSQLLAPQHPRTRVHNLGRNWLSVECHRTETVRVLAGTALVLRARQLAWSRWLANNSLVTLRRARGWIVLRGDPVQEIATTTPSPLTVALTGRVRCVAVVRQTKTAVNRAECKRSNPSIQMPQEWMSTVNSISSLSRTIGTRSRSGGLERSPKIS